jgi:tetratricopeptide (TPR) repeat protein
MRAAIVRAGCAAAGVLLGAGFAHASEDGGTQSVLASGAGLRAVAMGGVSVAIIEDASALDWNPAGLAFLKRGEFQAEQVDRSLLGARQVYVAGAWPSWRWGVMALSVHHFGVDGIERRDDRGVALAGDASATEDQFVLGYGRAMSRLWSIGGSVKLQRQQVAGSSGSGLGADIGLRARPAMLLPQWPDWTRRVTIGLRARNLVEPSIRLDQESVPDPSSVATGLAFEHELPGAGAVVWGLEMEAVRAGGSKLRAGVEMRPLDGFALRSGLQSGRLAAGAEVAWKSVRLLYAFEDQPLESVHRVGILVPFGASTDDARERARAAEARAFQTRLDRAFAAQQDARRVDLLQRAEAALAAGDADGAVRLLDADEDLLAHSPEIAAAYVRALRAQASALVARRDWDGAALSYRTLLARVPGDSAAGADLERCRQESDRLSARTATSGRMLAQALDAFAREQFAAARSILIEALALDPGDSTSSALLRRTGDAIRLRVPRLARQAATALDLRRLDEATRLLGEIRALDPKAQELVTLGARLESARRAPRDTAVAPVPAPAPALTQEAIREADRLRRLGAEALDRRRPLEAIAYWQRAWAIRPGDARLASDLERECLLRGMEAYAAGKLEQAVSLWQTAVQVNPANARAAGYLAKAREQLDRTSALGGDSR